MDELFLDRGEEALGDGVVEAVALGSHRLGDARGAGLLAEGKADELTGFNGSLQHLDLGGVGASDGGSSSAANALAVILALRSWPWRASSKRWV